MVFSAAALRLALHAAADDDDDDDDDMQAGPGSTARVRALVELVGQLCEEPAYNTLRTKEQLGYTVSW
jgi:secreted Zn-dependent insulinase-like peptidase